MLQSKEERNDNNLNEEMVIPSNNLTSSNIITRKFLLDSNTDKQN